MISASHNPYHDNGIKFFGPDGQKLTDEQEERITILMNGDLSRYAAASDRLGRATRIEDARARYVEFVKRTLPRHFRLDGLRVVVDCANGAAYRIAPTALWELGAEVISIGVEPNGFNINDGCGSTAPAQLQTKVREYRADIGIALDGEADRVIIVDEHGAIIDGDQILALLAARLQKTDELRGEGIVATVMSNMGLERYLTALGLTLHRTPVGDRYVFQEMLKTGCNLGGEQSGHIILSDYNSTGDGLVAALQVLAAVREEGRPASEVCHRFEPVPQVLKNVRYRGASPLKDAAVQKAIRAAEKELGDAGRLLIRASGTEPVIRVMVEGDDAAQIEAIADRLVAVLHRQAA